MTDTLTKIKADFLLARKAKDEKAKAFYSSLIGDIESAAIMINGYKTVSEDVTISTLKSTVKKCKEFLAIENLLPDTISKIQSELALAESYLPTQLTENQLREIFTSIDHSNMGLMMKHLKDNYSGQYDGKMASQIAKEFA